MPLCHCAKHAGALHDALLQAACTPPLRQLELIIDGAALPVGRHRVELQWRGQRLATESRTQHAAGPQPRAKLWARRRFVLGVAEEQVRANALLKVSLQQLSLTQPRGTRVGMRWDLLTSWLMGIEESWSGEVPISDEATLLVRIRVVACVRTAMEGM